MPFMPDAIAKDFTKPLIKETKDLIGGVKRLMVLPCSLPVEVYVETLLPAILGAWYEIIEPDAKEVYHKTTGKSFVCDVAGGAEKAYKASGLPEGKVTRFVFKIPAVYDIATWWFFLADVAAEGLVNWTSFAYAQRQCNAKNNPHYGSGSLWAGSLRESSPFSQVDFQYSEPSQFAPVAPSAVIVLPGRTGTIAMTTSWKLESNVEIGVLSQITFLSTGIMLDTYNNIGESGFEKGRNHVFAKGKNKSDEVLIMSAECRRADGFGGQAFADPLRCHCTMFEPP